MEMEHAVLRRLEQLAEEFSDLPLSLVVQVVSARADVHLDGDASAAEAARRELQRQRRLRSRAAI